MLDFRDSNGNRGRIYGDNLRDQIDKTIHDSFNKESFKQAGRWEGAIIGGILKVSWFIIKCIFKLIAFLFMGFCHLIENRTGKGKINTRSNAEDQRLTHPYKPGNSQQSYQHNNHTQKNNDFNKYMN